MRGRPALYNENRLFEEPKPRVPSLRQLGSADRQLLIDLRGMNEFEIHLCFDFYISILF